MGRVTTIFLREYVDDDTLQKLATILCHPRTELGPAYFDELDDEDDDAELSLFADHDVRGGGAGFFSQDSAELQTRRLDMRGPLDLDRGPIEMPEPAETEPVIELSFR